MSIGMRGKNYKRKGDQIIVTEQAEHQVLQTSPRYAAYLSKSPKPPTVSENINNLFDDSNCADSVWFQLAKEHISKKLAA